MQIHLSDISSSEGMRIQKTVEFGMDAITFQSGTFPVIAKEPIELTIVNTGDRNLEVTGTGKITVGIPCDRCLEEVSVEIPLEIERKLDMKLTDEDRVNDLDESSYLTGMDLDVDSVHFVGEDSDAFGKFRISISPFRDAMGESLVIFHFCQFHVRTVFQKPGNSLFVFCRRECAGRVKHQSAGTEHIGCLEDKLFLDFGKLHGFFGSPVFGKGFFLTEHSFSGAWSIQDDLVKEFGECFGKFGRCFICHEDIWNAE